MGKDKKIQILMSSFNGEKYIREQMNSFVDLDGFENVKVLIRDDGSADSTVSILKEYEQKYGFEIIEGRNVGVNKSIIELLRNCDMSCDYFALSDQDDVWLKNKFTLAVKILNGLDTKKPALFASCSRVVTEDLSLLGITLVPKHGLTFYNAMIQNVTPGHTQVFNRTLAELMIGVDAEFIHVIDWWIYLVAAGIGQVSFVGECTVLHRQHGKNSVGYELGFFKNSLMRFNRIKQKQPSSISLQLKAFDNKYNNLLENNYRTELKHYFSCQKTLAGRLKYIFSCKAYRQTIVETAVFKLLYLFGVYNIER